MRLFRGSFLWDLSTWFFLLSWWFHSTSSFKDLWVLDVFGILDSIYETFRRGSWGVRDATVSSQPEFHSRLLMSRNMCIHSSYPLTISEVLWHWALTLREIGLHIWTLWWWSVFFRLGEVYSLRQLTLIEDDTSPQTFW